MMLTANSDFNDIDKFLTENARTIYVSTGLSGTSTHKILDDLADSYTAHELLTKPLVGLTDAQSELLEYLRFAIR